MASPQAGFVDQQDPATASATLRSDEPGPAAGEGHDVVPRQVVAAGHLTDRHGVDVSDQLTGQTAGDVGAASHHDLGMLLTEPFPAVVAGEAAPDPHQRRRPASSRQIMDLEPAPIMHLVGFESAHRTADHPAGIADLHHQTFNQINHNGQYPDPAQVQTDRHSIRFHQSPSSTRRCHKSPIIEGL